MWGAAHPLVASPRASPARLRRTTSLREVAEGRGSFLPLSRRAAARLGEADAGEARRGATRGCAACPFIGSRRSFLGLEPASRSPPRGSQPHPPGPPPHEWGGGNVSHWTQRVEAVVRWGGVGWRTDREGWKLMAPRARWMKQRPTDAETVLWEQLVHDARRDVDEERDRTLAALGWHPARAQRRRTHRPRRSSGGRIVNDLDA